MLLDYELLRLIWWLLLGVLLIGFAVTDGFDLGVATLLPFLGKTDPERRVIINTVGPVWEGNQVWLLLGAGAIFAAWPLIYAAAFSGFYIAMFLTLSALILRPVGFKFRSKLTDPVWRSTWDWALFIGGAVPAIVFGVAVGNVLQGVPFAFNDEMRITYTGTFFELLNPFALVCGLISLSMLVMHGGAYLAGKTEGFIHKRATLASAFAAIVTVILYMLASYWIVTGIEGFAISAGGAGGGPSNPLLAKTVIRTPPESWLANFSNHPWMWAAPALAMGGAILGAIFGIRRKSPILTFWLTALSVTGIIATAGLGMFPFLMPSSIDLASSLTIMDASSSQRTLMIMLVVALIFVPVVLAYTAWAYRVMRGKVREEEVQSANYY